MGPGFNFSFFRGIFGPSEVRNYSLNNFGDTLWRIGRTNFQDRYRFASILGNAGLTYQVNHRLNFAFDLGGSLAFGRPVASQKIVYKKLNGTQEFTANATNTGSMTLQTLSVGYTIGATPKTIDRRVRYGRPGIDTSFVRRHKWQLQLLTSGFNPKITLTDEGGHLAAIKFQRFTYGARLRYRFAEKWYASAGFETLPFALDARPARNYFGFTDIQVNNAVQVPMMAEYRFLRTKGKINVDLFAAAGVSLGIQRQVFRFDNPSLPGWVHIPDPYYEDDERREGPGKTFWAPTAQLQAQLHLSRHIFLHGHLRYQHDFGGNTHFMQLRAVYRYGSNTAPIHNALYGQSPTAFMPGFGVGFKW